MSGKSFGQAVPPTIPASNNLDTLNVRLLKAGEIIGNTPGLPAPLVSIADLTTTSNDMIYTTASDTYATTTITGAGRSFVSALTANAQQISIGLEIGVDVQAFSPNLQTLDTVGSGAANNMVYTTGSGYSNSTLTPFARNTLLTAVSNSALASTLGYIIGPVSTVDSLLRVSGSNTVAETGISIDTSDNITGINDISVGNNLSVVGTIDGITATERAQLTNIDSTTISSTQWGYLGSMNQGIATTDTPAFNGLNASSSIITGVAIPISGTDAANKTYVDTAVSVGSAPLQQAELATTTVLPNTPAYASPAETLTSTGGPGSLTIDSVLTVVGDRILVKDQVTDTQNGIYDITDDGSTPGPNYVLTRSSDFDQAAMPKTAGTSIFIEINASATINTGSTWALLSTVTDVDPLTDSVNWVKIGGSQTFTSGNGIDATALGTSIIQTDITSRLKYTGSSIDLNTITVPFGGTGQTTLTNNGVLLGAGTGVVTSSKTAPSGDFVGTSDSQTLTNKVMTSSTNNVTAKSLFSNSGANAVSTLAAANPTSGQVLTATGTTTATWQTPSSSGSFQPDRTLFVSPSASDVRPNWSTLKDALADAVLLTPTASDNVIIFIYPGTYSEATPLSIPHYVNISSSIGIPLAVIIRPTTPAPVSPVFICTGNSALFGLVIDGNDGSGAFSTIGVDYSGTTQLMDSITACTIKNCSISGINVTGNGTTQFGHIVLGRSLTISVNVGAPFVMGAGIEVSSAGFFGGTDVTCRGFLAAGGVMTRGIYVHDDFSRLNITNGVINTCSVGIAVGGGVTSNSVGEYPNIRMDTCIINFSSETGVDILSKANATINNLEITDTSSVFPNSVDLKFTNPALPANHNVVILQNSNLRSTSISLFNGAINNPTHFTGTALSDIPGNNQTFMLSNFIIGSALEGRTFAAGEGNGNTLGMVVFQDNGGVFTDILSSVNRVTDQAFNTNIATTGSINLASAPATIDGIAPSSGVTRVLVKDGSSVNPGTDSVDNGIYLWNGTGSAMTREADFAAASTFESETYFCVDVGTINYGSCWKIDGSTYPGSTVTVGTTSFGLESYTSPAFPSPVTTNDAIYIGNLVNPFNGIKTLLTKPITLSSGTIADAIQWEFWNGSIWTTLDLMSTHSSPPYDSHANETMGINDAAVGNPDPVSFNYRFGEMTGWATTSVNSVTAYWVRCRVTTGANISQIPIIELLQTLPNHTKIDEDGFVEFFGNAEPTNTFNIAMSSVLQTGIAGITNPGNQELLVVDSGGIEIAALGINNSWDNTVDTAVTFIWNPSSNIDTSNKLNIKIPMSRSTGGNGDIALSVEYAFVVDGDVVKNTTGTTTATGMTTGVVAYPISTVSRGAFFVTIPLDITTLIPAISTLWFKLTRFGSDGLDTYNNSVYPHNIELNYKTWSNGGFA